jgi:hypothetical protein
MNVVVDIHRNRSSKSTRVGFSPVPGSPQEPHDMHEQHKSETIYSLRSDGTDNRPGMPTIDEHEQPVHSGDDDDDDDDDEHTDVLLDDDVHMECRSRRVQCPIERDR